MTETSGPPPTTTGARSAPTVADLRDRTQQRASAATAQLEQEQVEQMRAFGAKLMAAATDGMRSTKQGFLDERHQTLTQVHADQESIRITSKQMAAAARTSARMVWLPTLSICLLLIGGSLLFAWWKTTTASQTPTTAQTVTIKGQTYQVLTGPNWTTCTYDGRQRPCRPTKEK
jgi:hypothetical protein